MSWSAVTADISQILRHSFFAHKIEFLCLEAHEDTRMHMCLYFLQAHQLHDVDLSFIEELSTSLPVSVIIAKTDTLNDEELAEQRANVVQTFEKRKISVYFLDGHEQEGSSVTDLGLGSSSTDKRFPRWRKRGEPLAIVARNAEYPWGSVDSDNTQHSDFTYLRDVLLNKHCFRLIKQAEQKYTEFRKRKKTEEQEEKKKEQEKKKRMSKFMWIGAIFAIFLASAAYFGYKQKVDD